jgi:hypothetical protein
VLGLELPDALAQILDLREQLLVVLVSEHALLISADCALAWRRGRDWSVLVARDLDRLRKASGRGRRMSNV